MFLINPQNFQVGEIPKYHPASQKYLSFWRTQKKRCIEGYWSQGRWMPGKLYFYINFGTIKLNKKGSKVKSYGRPWLRDLEWEFFLNWEEARGFSGFSEDTEYTCLHSVKDLRDAGISVPTDYITRYHPEAIAPNGQLKKYIPPREYLRTVHPTSLGSPLHTNQARNLFMMGCHGKGTRVRMYNGSTKAVEDVQVGDKLLGPDGEPRIVQKLFYGLDDLYRIKQGKGNDYVVNSSHILHLENRFGQRINKLTEELISLKEHKGYIPNYKGIRSETIHYENNPQLSVDAYFVGLWLGDGTKGTAIITTGDEEEILPHLKTLNPDLSIYRDPDGKEDLNYCKINLKKHVKNQLEQLGILHDKHIPTAFMQVPYEQRMELLAGLLDSDGCLDNTAFDFYQKDYRLAKQVWELARSLGFFASITYSKSLYKVHITGEVTKIPTKISRKQATQDSNPYQTTTISIEAEGFGEYFGFEVDQDHLYLLEDFTITHNSRGYGKSYSVGVGIVAHEFLFDGQTIYDPEAPLTAAEIVMGAGDAKYSTETLDKTKTALDHLPGALELNGVYYPNPFAKQFRGSWAPAKQIEAKYKKKVAGSWVTLGTGSNIKHRTFKDNPFAANGTRPGVMIWEEVGMFDNLKESYNASVECQRDGAYKFGSMMFLGTGGDMNGGGTVDAQEIFYTPEQYDCVAFEDIWEHRGKIGYFVPAYMGLNQFKDENGHTDIEAAKKHLEETRNKYRKAKGSLSALEGEIVNRPLVPSEIFLQKQGNIFPVAELRQRLAKLEEHGRWAHLEKKVELFYDSEVKVTNGVTYKIDTRNKLQAINRFPWKENSREGAVVIYEFPELVDNKVPTGAYIIGHDPYAQDDEGESCAVTIVMKTKKYFSSIGHDEVVAIHVARPYDGRHVVNETLYKLSLFYGEARIYFENVRGNVKEFFEKKKRLDLLAKQPTTVMSKKASYNSSSNVIYGYPMSSKQMKIEGIQYVRDWLLEERKDENDNVIRNLDRIWDRALLQELIAFNMDGNFDRVMALIGCVIGMEETHNKYMEQTENKRIRDEVTTFLANNRSMFPNATPEQYLHTTTNNYEWIN